jgi:hypothetical protein
MTKLQIRMPLSFLSIPGDVAFVSVGGPASLDFTFVSLATGTTHANNAVYKSIPHMRFSVVVSSYPYLFHNIKSTHFLFSLFAAVSCASPLVHRQATCTTSGISATCAAEVRLKFLSSELIGDLVPDFTPTMEVVVKYGNIYENHRLTL